MSLLDESIVEQTFLNDSLIIESDCTQLLDLSMRAMLDTSLDTIDFTNLNILPSSLLSSQPSNQSNSSSLASSTSTLKHSIPPSELQPEQEERNELFSSTSSYKEFARSPHKEFQKKHRVVSIASESFYQNVRADPVEPKNYQNLLDSPRLSLMTPLKPSKPAPKFVKLSSSPVKSPRKKIEELIIWEDFTPATAEVIEIGGKEFEAGGDYKPRTEFKRSNSLELLESRLQSLKVKSTPTTLLATQSSKSTSSRLSMLGQDSSVIFGGGMKSFSSSGSIDNLATPLLPRYLPASNRVPIIPLTNPTPSSGITKSPTVTRNLTTLLNGTPRKDTTAQRLEKMKGEREERAKREKSPEKKVIMRSVLGGAVPIATGSMNGISRASMNGGSGSALPSKLQLKSKPPTLPSATTTSSRIPPRSGIPSGIPASSRISRPMAIPKAKLSKSPTRSLSLVDLSSSERNGGSGSARNSLVRPLASSVNGIRKPNPVGTGSTNSTSLIGVGGRRLPVSNSSRSVGRGR